MSSIWITFLVIAAFTQGTYSCNYEYLNYDPEYDEDIDETNVLITCAHVSLSNLTYDYRFGEYRQILRIVKSNISTIPKLAFQKTRRLTKLHLDGAGVRNIEAGGFANLTNLEELHINNNPLDEIGEDIFNGLNALKVLDLSDNQISKLHGRSLNGVENLEEVYLRNNKIGAIESDFLSGKLKLRVLDLSGNPLVRARIVLPHQSLSLNLSRTGLKPDNSIFIVDGFDKLDWSYCHLLEVDFQKFPKVTVLDLSYNQLKTIDSFPNNVKNLNLSHNSLQTIEFNKSSSLSILDVSFNKLSNLERHMFEQLTSLEVLILSHNNITNFEPVVFRNLTNLTLLDLSHNSIEKLKYGTFDTLTNLVTLDISHNKLSDLHQYSFHSLTNLRNLYFDNNQISYLAVEDLRRHLRNLQTISLNGNKFSCQNLVTIQQFLNIFDVKVLKGSTYDEDNFHGVACTNNKDSGLSSMILQKIVNESIRHSKMEAFFNRDFNKSKFVQYFEKGYSESQFFKSLSDQASDNKALIVSSVVQIILSCVLLSVILYVFIHVRRMVGNHRASLLTQIEL